MVIRLHLPAHLFVWEKEADLLILDDMIPFFAHSDDVAVHRIYLAVVPDVVFCIILPMDDLPLGADLHLDLAQVCIVLHRIPAVEQAEGKNILLQAGIRSLRRVFGRPQALQSAFIADDQLSLLQLGKPIPFHRRTVQQVAVLLLCRHFFVIVKRLCQYKRFCQCKGKAVLC